MLGVIEQVRLIDPMPILPEANKVYEPLCDSHRGSSIPTQIRYSSYNNNAETVISMVYLSGDIVVIRNGGDFSDYGLHIEASAYGDGNFSVSAISPGTLHCRDESIIKHLSAGESYSSSGYLYSGYFIFD